MVKGRPLLLLFYGHMTHVALLVIEKTMKESDYCELSITCYQRPSVARRNMLWSSQKTLEIYNCYKRELICLWQNANFQKKTL